MNINLDLIDRTCLVSLNINTASFLAAKNKEKRRLHDQMWVGCENSPEIAGS